MNLVNQSLELLAKVTSNLPDGGERRVGQDEMTATVAERLAKGGHVVVQAGTGTGKSLAYLVPAVLSQQKVVVATATKALQDQLADKDLPFLAAQLDTPIKFAVLKGRSNYLCLQRLSETESSTELTLELGDRVSKKTLKRLRVFADQSETGDRSELTDVSDADWQAVSVGRQECPGSKRCPAGESCFAEKAWRRAAAADVLIVNLYLYAIDVAAESILPEHETVIIDEAHQLEDIVAQAAGCYLSPARLSGVAAATKSLISDSDAPKAVEEAATMLKNRLEPLSGTRLADGLPDDLDITVDLVSNRVGDLLSALRGVPDSAPTEVLNRAIRARQAIGALLEDINRLRQHVNDEVMWVEGLPQNAGLRCAPLAIDKILGENLWSERNGILTSATMPTNALTQLGLPEDTVASDVGSPFDYEANALLYCAADLPDPRHAGHREAQLVEIKSLIRAAGGRTLALFTSWAAMQEAAEAIASRIPWPLLKQGDDSKSQLLRKFLADEETCLFATMSYWQGIDAVGSSCNLVIINRLPFPRPDDPLLQARRERVGAAAFRLIDLPRAAIMLAQGAGRLIRSASDCGVVAVLDPRLATSRSYRWELLSALPPMRRTKDREEAERWLHTLRERAEEQQ